MIIYIDFDGTITKTDTTDDLLEKFAVGNFNEIEQDWLCGRINSKECMEAQFKMIRAKEVEIKKALESIIVDENTIDFCHLLQDKAKLVIVSDGIDYPIDHFLKRSLLSIPYYANHLSFLEDTVEISFPFQMDSCKAKSGLCKCQIYHKEQLNGAKSILIGNGKSDTCLAHQVDLVFAKDYLFTYCQQNGIKHIKFNSFLDLIDHIEPLFKTPSKYFSA